MTRTVHPEHITGPPRARRSAGGWPALLSFTVRAVDTGLTSHRRPGERGGVGPPADPAPSALRLGTGHPPTVADPPGSVSSPARPGDRGGMGIPLSPADSSISPAPATPLEIRTFTQGSKDV